MNAKKQKEKDRRRARKLAEQAWEAVDAGNFDLAEKIIRRAVTAQPDNPILWNDQGMILGLRQNEVEAAECFRAAISLAPSFAEPYAHLAALRTRQGFAREAAALQAQAVKHAPQNPAYAAQLEAYQLLAGKENPLVPPSPLADKPTPAATEAPTVLPADQPWGDWSKRLAELDWHALGERLTRAGCVRISGLINAPTCEHLRKMFDDDALFAKTVVMDQPEFGLGVYRYFRAPIPAFVDQLRRAVYPQVALIANGWQRVLGEPERYPAAWEAFAEECRRAGQTVPTPILLKYGPGGFNGLHRDLHGSVFFPIQLAVVLSARAESTDEQISGFRGGEFLFCDIPEGRKSRRRAIPAGLGDVVLFGTRDRLVPVGGAYGLQPVKHGAAPVTAGTRFVLGVPFHEYR